jgi:hypothetical protein
MARDVQMSRCYAWERTSVYPHRDARQMLTLDQCRALAERVCKDHGVTPPRLPNTRKKRNGCYRRLHHEIHLPAWTRFTEYTLHEVTHALRREVDLQGAEQSHGAAFMRDYITLLVRYAGHDEAALCLSAKMAGLRVAPCFCIAIAA